MTTLLNRRNLITFFITLSIVFLHLNSCNGQPIQAAKTYPEISLLPKDRILILAPHPDDETIACGGIIQEALKKGIPVKIVFLTYGDNNQWAFFVYRKHPVIMPKAAKKMGLLRHDEAIAAAKILGISKTDLTFLGYPDFRTLNIWYSHWGDRPPGEGMLTHVKKVPYASAFHPGAAYKGENILKDLETIIRDFRPTKIFVSHPIDHNPDHRALYLFTQIALWDLGTNIKKPAVYPYLVHYGKWPRPMKFAPDAELLPPSFLKDMVKWQMFGLTGKEKEKKFEALRAHKSQYKASPKYMRLFIRSNELFGNFPVVKLKNELSFVPVVENRETELSEEPEQLLKDEKAAFVGVKSTYVELENDHLVFTIKLSRPIGKAVGLSIYAFGYKKGTDFALMPKIHIKFGAIQHKIFDQDKLLNTKLVDIKRYTREITIRIPLDVLGNPDKILTSGRTYIGNIPLDWVSWRVLELSK